MKVFLYSQDMRIGLAFSIEVAIWVEHRASFTGQQLYLTMVIAIRHSISIEVNLSNQLLL